jgi:hypothetical protein
MGRANNLLANSVSANLALLGGILHSTKRHPEPTQGSTKPMRWIGPTWVARWNLPLGAQHLGHSLELGPHLHLRRQRELPPKPSGQPTASTGEQAATSGWQLSYAEVGEVYTMLMAGQPVKGVNVGVDSSAMLPTKNRASEKGKGERDVKLSHRTPPETKSPRGKKDVTVCTTTGGHSVTHPATCSKPSGPLKPTVKGIGSPSVPVASMEAAQRHAFPRAPSDMSGPMGGMPTSTTSFPKGSCVTEPWPVDWSAPPFTTILILGTLLGM